MRNLVVFGGIIGVILSFNMVADIQIGVSGEKTAESSTSAKPQAKAPKSVLITHPLIHFIDKLMPAGAYGLILKVRREVRNRLYGVATKSGRRLGMYQYEGRSHTATSLAKIESQHEMEYYSQKDYLIKNKAKYSEDEWAHEMESIEKTYAERTKDLRKVLEEAKDGFIAITESYLESARGTKDQVLMLIKDSCNKRGMDGCFILRWGETEEGNETDLLKNEVVTFKEFAKFCYDLSNFLEDMARSCTRSKKRFIDFVRKNRRSN